MKLLSETRLAGAEADLGAARGICEIERVPILVPSLRSIDFGTSGKGLFEVSTVQKSPVFGRPNLFDNMNSATLSKLGLSSSSKSSTQGDYERLKAVIERAEVDLEDCIGFLEAKLVDI
jgi:hypothetical protein